MTCRKEEFKNGVGLVPMDTRKNPVEEVEKAIECPHCGNTQNSKFIATNLYGSSSSGYYREGFSYKTNTEICLKCGNKFKPTMLVTVTYFAEKIDG